MILLILIFIGIVLLLAFPIWLLAASIIAAGGFANWVGQVRDEYRRLKDEEDRTST